MTRRNSGLITLLVMGALLISGNALAGTTGGIAGNVRDASSGQPVTFANVTIPELQRGTSTDSKGDYVLLNLPPGRYTVKIELLGYVPQAETGVEVHPDFNAKLDFSLVTTVLKSVQEVEVKAERPLIQKDVTGTTKFLSGEDIKNQPVRGYQEAVAQQAGVVNFNLNNLNQVNGQQAEIQDTQNSLIVRGGRPNEVAYFVDGFSQQDPLSGLSTTSIAADAIDEVVVQAGGYNAEYGRVNSGIVNVVTREGGDQYAGSLEGILGDYMPQSRGYKIFSGAVGGPVSPSWKNATFFLSGERRDAEDRRPSFITNELGDPSQPGLFENGVLPSNDSKSWASAGKFAFRPDPLKVFRLAATYNSDDWRQYLNSYRFDLAHSPRYEDKNWSTSATWNHSLSERTYYEVKANYFSTERERGDGVYFDNLKAYSRPAGNPSFSSDGLFWNGDDPSTSGDDGHVSDNFMHRKSSYVGFAANYASQVSHKFQVKAGGDFQRHTLRYFDHYAPTQAYDANGNPSNIVDADHYGYDALGHEINGGDTFTDLNGNGSRDPGEPFQDKNGNGIYDNPLDGPKHPKVASMYMQGKYEQLGVVVNGGLRWDYLTPSTQALKSETYPLGGEFADSTNDPSALGPQDLQASKVYQRLSPRLGVGFPVNDRTLLHVNYGKFFQQPNLEDLYASYSFLDYKINNVGYFVGFGNPNLKPEETTAYEIGIQHTPTDRSRIEATAYYKDVKDLVEIVNIPSYPAAFSSYRNIDFATIKGLDLAYTMRRSGHFAMNAAYSLSWANGTGSVDESQRVIAWTAAETPKMASPLAFDQRHKLSLNFDFRYGKGEGPAWGGMRFLENTGIDVLMSAGSGTPYTPTKVYNAVTLGAVFPTPTGEINSRYGPWTSSMDVKAGKTMSLGRENLEVYVWVMNLLDQKNVVNVYTATGSAETTGFLNTDAGQQYLAQNGPDTAERYRLASLNPDFFGTPRLVRFGAKLNF